MFSSTTALVERDVVASPSDAEAKLGCRWKVAIAGAPAAQWFAEQLLDEQRPDAFPPSDIASLRAANAELSRSHTEAMQAADDLMRSSADLYHRNPNVLREIEQIDPNGYARWKKDIQTVLQLMREAQRAG